MCKVKQLNGEAPRVNNYCTAREYEVFTIIAKNVGYNVGDVISGEQLSNKTAGRQWVITECNRVDGGHVSIKDNKGNEKTCMFVFGKGTATAKPTANTTNTTATATATEEQAAQQPTGANKGAALDMLAQLQRASYNDGYNKATEEAAAKVEALTAEVEELKAQPKGTGTTINITINGETNTTTTEAVLHPKFARVCKYIANRKHVYLYGPAGTGKNVLAEQVAKSLGLEFFYINTLYTKYDVTGFMDANGNYVPTVVYNFLKADNGLLLVDEIDNSMAEALIPINSLLANGYLTFANGETLHLDENHKILAAANTNGQGATEEYNGRYKMDESTRSRFAFIFINYDAAVEKSIVGNSADILDFINDLRKVRNEINISMILGYREIKNLKDFEDDDDLAEIVDNFVTKGMEQDTINEIASRLDNATKWHKAFKALAK